jgi:D-serine deaminase-like pyridoxal phosphate-dependent protein
MQRLSTSGVYTELQFGSYIFTDADSRGNLRPRRRPDEGPSRAPSSGATVMNRPAEDRAIVDAGLKALA